RHGCLDARRRLCAAPAACGLAVSAGDHGAVDHVDPDVSELLIEEAVIRPAAEFAIGHEAEAELLLQSDRVADGMVLRGGEVALRDLAARKTCPGIEQRLWTQQAAEVLGAERWHLP